MIPTNECGFGNVNDGCGKGGFFKEDGDFFFIGGEGASHGDKLGNVSSDTAVTLNFVVLDKRGCGDFEEDIFVF